MKNCEIVLIQTKSKRDDVIVRLTNKLFLKWVIFCAVMNAFRHVRPPV